MLVSIVTGTYNRLELLRRMMDSARLTMPVGFDYEFIIVDGGSEDGTLDYLATVPDATVIAHGELKGAIVAFCDGAKAATGKYVLLANDDIEFHRGSIVNAILHLERNDTCGAVAFADNRPILGKKAGKHAVLGVPRKDKPFVFLNYAQVGLFRRWLGDLCGWWGADDPAFLSHTYGGDNYLSAKIWEYGYTVDAVAECKVHDLVAVDGLRERNVAIAEAETQDGAVGTFNQLWHGGIPVGIHPFPENQNKELLRVLYLPIYERDHVEQHRQKRGLRDALSKYFLVWELDYLALPQEQIQAKLEAIIKVFDPDIIFTQAHGADLITANMLQQLRARYKRQFWLNWNGDYWPHGLTAEPMMELLAYYDLQLVVNASVLPKYQSRGIAAAYWQIGYEDAPLPQQEFPLADVVFLGSSYGEHRKQLEHALSPFDTHFYGDGWQHSRGNTLYDFEAGVGIYRNAKIAISDNAFPDARGFVSNRLFQALAAGGAIVLQQRVNGLQELTGLVAGVHYLEFETFEDMQERIEYCLNPENEKERGRIAEAGTAFVREFHSFEARVLELFAGDNALISQAHRVAGRNAYLKYTGRNPNQFGVKGRTGKKYTHKPGELLAVAPQDAEYLLRTEQDKWQLVPEPLEV